MIPSKKPLTTDLVFIGGGHAHVHVLKMLGMHDSALLQSLGVQITVISSVRHTPYSGMLPGYLAGHYDFDEIHLDVGKLTRLCSGRFIHAAATAIRNGKIYLNDDRPPVRYDILSIDIGSSPSQSPMAAIPVKPIASFCEQYDSVLHTVRQKDAVRVCVIGGGAGGMELALAFHHRVATLYPDKIASLEIAIVTRSTMMESHGRAFQKIVRRILEQRNIRIIEHTTVDRVEPNANGNTVIVEHDTPLISVDAVFWCVSARGADWLNHSTPFPTTEENFLRVKDTYECEPGVFATGDCCHMDAHPRPKAGVFAVRAGPVLYENILRTIRGKPLRRHTPQSAFLQLISTGDKYAVASYYKLAIGGKWVWRVKDWIDRTWMAKYSTDLPDMEQMMEQMERKMPRHTAFDPDTLQKRKGENVLAAFQSNPMRCGGCGAKVGSSTLSRVLKAVQERQRERAIKLGLPSPPPMDYDDAAVTVLPPANGSEQQALIQTIDFFREMINDPFVFGKLASIHALSDIHAMGASAQSAMALAVAPFAADEEITESTLLHLLSGVSDVLQDEGIRLVGGHTCEGHELSCGLSVQGFTRDRTKLLTKRGGKIGDTIVLTKPIGTGALFAAEMRGQCKGDYVAEAIHSMLKSNLEAGKMASEFPAVHACTDVTGFGLIGHLLEMLSANDEGNEDPINAALNIGHIQFLQGGLEASRKNIFSSLQPQNARNRRAVQNHAQAAKEFPVKYPLLFDPQTAGGLLMFVSNERSEELVQLLQSKNVEATSIGCLERREIRAAAQEQPTTNGLTCGIDTDSPFQNRIKIVSSF